ncbi:hypothetical protein CDL12_16119 [Handroanthus impetiginosus]|uniref:Uncharacterized protein n=1 Tax=Handroanthus impetiginosus TaxID=429701 RepID=A0A2G9H1A2_9LAMI|nr:hypothetical protein CDL12_16119 [Handroanthus impetiginosus]
MPDFQIVPKSLCISGPRNWLHYHYRTSLSPCRNFNRIWLVVKVSDASCEAHFSVFSEQVEK